MTLDEATVIADRYVLTDLLGRGGMADVYRARDRVLDREVAVKLLREATDDDTLRDRFVDEAVTLASLSHRGIVTILDAGTTSARPFLVMELVEGPSLNRAAAGSPLPLEQVARIGLQVAEALAAAHATGIVHRDVKPGNVLMATDGRVMLADFGIARLLGETSRHTRTGLTIGSPAYLSPEQVQGGEISAAIDVYSLGLVLIEALTGRAAYDGTPVESAIARLHSAPALPDGLPAGWQRLLRDMTALDPMERPSAAEVAARIQRLVEGEEPVDLEETRVVTPVPLERPQALRSGWSSPDWLPTGHRLQLAAGALLALIVVLVLVLALGGGDEPAPPSDEIPAGVPPRLEQPLQDLHNAVNEVPE